VLTLYNFNLNIHSIFKTKIIFYSHMHSDLAQTVSYRVILTKFEPSAAGTYSTTYLTSGINSYKFYSFLKNSDPLDFFTTGGGSGFKILTNKCFWLPKISSKFSLKVANSLASSSGWGYSLSFTCFTKHLSLVLPNAFPADISYSESPTTNKFVIAALSNSPSLYHSFKKHSSFHLLVSNGYYASNSVLADMIGIWFIISLWTLGKRKEDENSTHPRLALVIMITFDD